MAAILLLLLMSTAGDLETVVNGSFDADEIVGALKQLETNDTSIGGCDSECCCSNRWIDHIDQVFSAHPGQTIIILTDCMLGLNENVSRRLEQQVEKSRTVVWTVKLYDSYCRSAGDQLNQIDFARYKFELSSQWYNAIWSFPFLTHGRDFYSSTFIFSCSNETTYFPNGERIRMLSYFLHEGQLKSGTWKVSDPSGQISPKNTHLFIDDRATGVRLQSIYADCQLGWRFANGKCLYYESKRVNYEDATENCRRLGAKLLTQFSDADLLDEDYFEMTEAESDPNNVMEMDSGNVWLGLDDLNEQKVLRWNLRRGFISDSNMGFTRWGPGQPSSSVAGARCASVNRRNVWSTSYCKSLLRSVCVRAAKEVDYPNGNATDYLPAGTWTMELDSFPSCYLLTASFK